MHEVLALDNKDLTLDDTLNMIDIAAQAAKAGFQIDTHR